MNWQQLNQRFMPYLNGGLGAPIFLMLILGMLVIPLPPFLLDLLFSFNITLSLIIILAVIYVQRPLDLGVFPTVLLLVTLLRLSLNVASTRIVLLMVLSSKPSLIKGADRLRQFLFSAAPCGLATLSWPAPAWAASAR